MSAFSSSSSESVSGSRVSSAVQQGAVAVFGALILYAVGFLPMSAAHNAAHDTRHTFVFPCH
ncbi:MULTISPECIES: CbtB domain-containing protein [Marinobacter]|uniref:CbtB domain-containing protein n=1 Tax=Marinobacter TaxID=2742 RepID=UPI000DAD8235|nr:MULTISPECIES: CbtB domain-containing protein [Marinobacter]